MAITDESGGTGMYMPVAPAYGGGGGGFGFGGDWAWIILLLVLCGGWGFGGGMGGFDGLYPWMNNSQNINDGFRDQMLNTQLTSIGDRVSAGFGDVGVGMLQATNSIQSQLAQCCCDNRLATCQTQNVIATESAATRSAISSGVQSILDKMCQDKIDAKNEKIVELNNRINSLEANNYIQNALTAQTQYFLGLYPPPAAV